MRYMSFFMWVCAVLAAAAVSDAKPAQKLPVFVKYNISYTKTSGSKSTTSVGSITLHGKLERVDKWSAPHKESNYYRGQLTVTYRFRARIQDNNPNRDCPPLVSEWSCAGSKTSRGKTYIHMDYWGEIHRGRPSKYRFSCPGVNVTATLVHIKEPDCLRESRKLGVAMGSTFIEGKYKHGQQVIHNSCSWSGPAHPANYSWAGELGVSVVDDKPQIFPVPGATIVGDVSWVFGADAVVIIEQNRGGIWTGITDPKWKQPAVVGEAIELRARVFPESLDTGQGEWTIGHDKSLENGEGPKFIKKFEANDKCGKAIKLKKEDTKKSNIKFYWVDSGGGHVKYVTTAGGKQLDAKAEFDIERPNVELSVIAQDESEFGKVKDRPTDPGYYILAYQKSGEEGMQWRVDKIDKPGETQYVQLIDQEAHAVAMPTKTKYPGPWRSRGVGLDTTYPYKRGREAKDNPGIPSSKQFSSRSAHFQYKMYLMFKPAGREDNEWVPIKLTDWFWGGKIVRDDEKNEWKKAYSHEPRSPKPVDTTIYPEWDTNCDDFPVEWQNPKTGKWEEIKVKWE